MATVTGHKISRRPQKNGELKTYSHLASSKRVPTEYEIVTSKLHYYLGRGFELPVLLAEWYRRYQTASPLQADDWEAFRDPRQTTYTRYTALQSAKEAHVLGIMHSIEANDYDATLKDAWLVELESVLSPTRYLFHGLQMAAAYVGQLAPSGRVTITCALQTADEMRRVQHIAYRIAQLRRAKPNYGNAGKTLWTQAESWQPLRKLIETMLVTWDWGEAFTALNLCVKPMIDQLLMSHYAERAKDAGDYLLFEVFFSLNEDCIWHRQWSGALVTTATLQKKENIAVIRHWVRLWLPRVCESLVVLAASINADFSVDRATQSTLDHLSVLKVAP